MGLKDLRGNLKDTELRQVLNRLRLAGTTTFAGTGFTSTTTAGTAVVGTLNSSGLSMGVPAFLTTAMASNRGSDFVQATATVAGTSISGTIASNVISLSVGPYLTTAMASNRGSDFVQATATIAGTNLTGTIASNGISLSVSNGGDTVTLSYFRLIDPFNSITSSWLGSSHVVPFLLQANYSFDRLRVLVSGSLAASSTQATTGGTSLSMSAVTSHNIGIYKRLGGASSQSLMRVTYTAAVDQCLMTASIAANSSHHSVSLRYTYGNQSFTKDYSSTVTRQDWHTSHLTDLTGVRYLDIPLGISLTPGQYWMIYGRSTTKSTQNNSISVATRLLASHDSMFAVSMQTLDIGMLGGQTHSSVQWWPGLGRFTTVGGGITDSLPISAVSRDVGNNVLYGQLMGIA